MKHVVFAALSLAALALMLASCATPRQRGQDYGDLRSYETADPQVDLEAAIKRNDLRFKALRGLAVDVPGVDDSFLTTKYGVDIIEGTSDFILDYEHGRLMAIAQYYSRQYNSALLRHIDKFEGKRISTSLNGYPTLQKEMLIYDEETGEFDDLPYGLSAWLDSLVGRCVRYAWWADPIVDGKPQNDWLQFLEAYHEVDEAACAHKWIQDWIHAGHNRAAQANILGVQPHMEGDFDWLVKEAWSDAQLEGEPYYELWLRSGEQVVATVFIARDRSVAVILKLSTQEAGDQGSTQAHWLDGKDFMYHPTAATKELIVVDQAGTWSLKSIANAKEPEAP